MQVDLFVELLEKGNRFEVLATAVLVGDPIPFFAAVVEIQHRGDRVDSQPIDVILIQPEQGVGSEEIADFVAAVIKNPGSPVGVFALARVGVLVEGGAVVVVEPVLVLRKVGRHPIDQHANAVLMAVIDKVLEVVRRTVAAGHRIVANGLVAPAAGERVLGDRHQLQVGIAQLVAILDQLLGQVAVVEPFAVPIVPAPPTAQVDFVDRDRGVQRVEFLASSHPLLIAPVVLVEVGHDVRRAGGHFGGEAVGVDLVDDVPAAVLDREFVKRTDRQLGEEQFPNAARDVLTHRVGSAVPAIEVAHDADAFRIGGPNGKVDSHHVVDFAHVGAELTVAVPVTTFA